MIVEMDMYDGSMIQDRFAYRFFKEHVSRTGNIISFRSPMKVEADFMVDLEDLEQSDFIYSADAINFLIEIPDISLYAGVCFQRLFNSGVAGILAEIMECDIEVDGDDIRVKKEHTQGGIVQQDGKASVSIAKYCNGAVLIHTGINIVAGKSAPAFAFSTNLSDQNVGLFMTKCTEYFYMLSNDIFKATTKIVK